MMKGWGGVGWGGLSSIEASVHHIHRVLGTPPDIQDIDGGEWPVLPSIPPPLPSPCVLMGFHSLGWRPPIRTVRYGARPLGRFDLLGPGEGAILRLQHAILMVAE